jgi:hypothetical protein
MFRRTPSAIRGFSAPSLSKIQIDPLPDGRWVGLKSWLCLAVSSSCLVRISRISEKGFLAPGDFPPSRHLPLEGEGFDRRLSVELRSAGFVAILNTFTATHASFATTHASFTATHASFATTHAWFAATHASFTATHASFTATHASFTATHASFAANHASFVAIQVVVAINLARKGSELFVFETNTVAAVTNHDSDVMKMIVSVTIARSM